MPRYRVKFSKDGPARFSSHLDMVRFFDRCTRRASLPVAFSEGFNPHPKFSFAAPLPVGIAGMAELMDMELTRPINTTELAQKLAENMPEGYEILDVKEAKDKGPALMAMVSRADYRATAALPIGYSEPELNSSIYNIMNYGPLPVVREIKGKIKETDIREGIFSLTGSVKGHILEINMELLIGSTGNVRPNEVLLKLNQDGGVPIKPEEFRVRRIQLYTDGKTGPVSLWET